MMYEFDVGDIVTAKVGYAFSQFAKGKVFTVSKATFLYKSPHTSELVEVIDFVEIPGDNGIGWRAECFELVSKGIQDNEFVTIMRGEKKLIEI